MLLQSSNMSQSRLMVKSRGRVGIGSMEVVSGSEPWPEERSTRVVSEVESEEGDPEGKLV
jgi:hypothetical protein